MTFGSDSFICVPLFREAIGAEDHGKEDNPIVRPLLHGF